MPQRSDEARDRVRAAMDAEGDRDGEGAAGDTGDAAEIDPADLIWIRDVIKARANGGHYGLPASTLYTLMRRYPELGPYSLPAGYRQAPTRAQKRTGALKSTSRRRLQTARPWP